MRSLWALCRLKNLKRNRWDRSDFEDFKKRGPSSKDTLLGGQLGRWVSFPIGGIKDSVLTCGIHQGICWRSKSHERAWFKQIFPWVLDDFTWIGIAWCQLDDGHFRALLICHPAGHHTITLGLWVVDGVSKSDSWILWRSKMKFGLDFVCFKWKRGGECFAKNVFILL